MIRFKCPKCEKRLQVDDSKAGGNGVCPQCGEKFRIPGDTAKTPDRPKPSESKKPPSKHPAGPGREAAIQPAQKSTPRPEESWERRDSTPYAVQKQAERDEDPLDKYRPRPKYDGDAVESEFAFDRDYSKKRKKKKEHEAARLGRIQTIVLGVGLVVVGVGLVLFAYFVKDYELVPRTLAGLIAGGGFIGLLLAAQEEGTAPLLLCLFVPFYNIYFAITHWKSAGKYLLMAYIGDATLAAIYLIPVFSHAAPPGQ